MISNYKTFAEAIFFRTKMFDRQKRFVVIFNGKKSIDLYNILL